MTVLQCPVCQGSMKEINKSGILVDTCTQCRGVWLDRGELEKLASVVGGGGVPEPRGFLGGALTGQASHRNMRRDDDDDDDDARSYRGSSSQRRRRSFLDFFD